MSENLRFTIVLLLRFFKSSCFNYVFISNKTNKPERYSSNFFLHQEANSLFKRSFFCLGSTIRVKKFIYLFIKNRVLQLCVFLFNFFWLFFCYFQCDCKSVMLITWSRFWHECLISGEQLVPAWCWFSLVWAQDQSVEQPYFKDKCAFFVNSFSVTFTDCLARVRTFTEQSDFGCIVGNVVSVVDDVCVCIIFNIQCCKNII